MEVISSKESFRPIIRCGQTKGSNAGAGAGGGGRCSFPLKTSFPKVSKPKDKVIQPHAMLDDVEVPPIQFILPYLRELFGYKTVNNSFQVGSLIQVRRKSDEPQLEGMVVRMTYLSFALLHKGGLDVINFSNVNGVTVLIDNLANKAWEELKIIYPGLWAFQIKPIGVNEFGGCSMGVKSQEIKQLATASDTLTDRAQLGLGGLISPQTISCDEQYEHFMESYHSLEKNTYNKPKDVVALAKWKLLDKLHEENETLYYKVLIDNIEAFAPIIYTPNVGFICQKYAGLFRRPRGMYISRKDIGEMMSVIYNWPSTKVDIILVTDGSCITGLGDLGVQGIGFPIGKLDMYIAAAGINPQRILPVMLDVGTSNQKLLDDPLYLGVREERVEGEEYTAIVDEFMEAVYTRWPRAIVQFEDFQLEKASKTLQRYQKKFCMFNDDIQGTAGVALAGLLGAVRAQNRPLSDIVKQKIVIVGAGSGGRAVRNMVKKAVCRMTGINEAKHNPFWLVDEHGLVTRYREDVDPSVADFARDLDLGEIKGLSEGSSLLEVVKKVKPHILLGISGVAGIITEEVLKAMHDSDASHPAIFSLSSPSMNAECTAADAFKYAGENIIFVSGSHFENFYLGNGKLGHVNKASSMYLFPGIALGTLLSGSHVITDGMLLAAAECLASYVTDEQIKNGILYPSISSIRHLTAAVAAAIVQEAVAHDLAAKELLHMSKDETVEYVARNMWFPVPNFGWLDGFQQLHDFHTQSQSYHVE